MKRPAAAKTRRSLPSAQYMIPRFGPLARTPGSKVHRRVPVAALTAKALWVGVLP
jgi:hypothetical protein